MIPPHRLIPAAAIGLALTLFTGCQSKQDAAIEQAKKVAAATGQPQQVITADKAGNVTTTTIQPPAPGQTTGAITTTVTPATTVPANSPAVAPGTPAEQPTTASVSQPAVAPVPRGAPVVAPAEVRVPAGTTLAIRINQHISVKTSRAGDRFDGEVVDPVLRGEGNGVIIPKGTPVGGVIEASHSRGRFKGASILELRLTSLTLNGTRYPIASSDLTRTKKGKGKRSAALIGGGTGLGMLLGGVAGGGSGMLIGGLAGAGAGTATAGLTGNRDLDIPSESIVRFKLADDLVVHPS
ncbi:hypothetical protein [Edaphobacter bradus]|uniref:hypothetical protein n=1 Tax=Edaphobacter bradus TaxID=2259016 RepID=UPI0021E0D999|nr:hypothetical protein [Edaphobacter bradus]